jgi:hypothetical protein
MLWPCVVVLEWKWICAGYFLLFSCIVAGDTIIRDCWDPSIVLTLQHVCVPSNDVDDQHVCIPCKDVDDNMFVSLVRTWMTNMFVYLVRTWMTNAVCRRFFVFNCLKWEVFVRLVRVQTTNLTGSLYMCVCVNSLYFASLYHFSIALWNCSDSEIYFVFHFMPMCMPVCF